MEKINIVQEKLIQEREKFELDLARLEKLKDERASLLASEIITGKKKEAKVDILNEKIKKLKLQVEEIAPDTIVGLESGIAQLKEENFLKDKKKKEKKQLLIEKELSEDSEKLILALEEILPLNKKVRDGWGEFNKIAKSTGRTKLSGKYRCSGGSENMLSFVATILLSEWRGEKIQRQASYNNIRL